MVTKHMDAETSKPWNEWCDGKINAAIDAHDNLLFDAITEYVIEETGKLREMIGELQTEIAVLRGKDSGATRSSWNPIAFLLRPGAD